MATLNAGGTSTVTLTLEAFASVAVVCDASCNGTLVFTSGAPNLKSNYTSKLQNKTYGPFPVPGTVTIAVTAGNATYTVTGALGNFNYDGITNPVSRNATTGAITAYTQGGTSFTVTYGSFGVATITGGGFTLTQNYTTAGIPSGVILT